MKIHKTSYSIKVGVKVVNHPARRSAYKY